MPMFFRFFLSFSDFPYLYCVKCRSLYDPFCTRKTPISENNSLMTPF